MSYHATSDIFGWIMGSCEGWDRDGWANYTGICGNSDGNERLVMQ